MINQRDIVEIYFDEDFGGNHPAVVLSNKLVQEIEGYFVCVMITSKRYDDEFTFEVTDEMLLKPLNRNYCEVRCQLIQFVPEEDIIQNNYHNQLKKQPFKKLIEKINQSTFSTEEL